METKYYRVIPRLAQSPRWWVHAKRTWPDHIPAVRPLIDGEEIILSAEDAERLREWAVKVIGWPKLGDFPLQFSSVGFIDATGAERSRWAIKLWVTEGERATIQARADALGKSVGALLRDGFFFSNVPGEDEE